MNTNNPSDNPRFVILVAVDDAAVARDVVRVGANFARTIPGSELHVLHVIVDLPSPARVPPAPPGLGVAKTELIEAGRRLLADRGGEARAAFGGRIVTHLAAGPAANEILQFAIDLQADLILVGTHGRTGLKRMLVGSIAESVVRKAACPVLVVRPKDYHAFLPPEIEPPCPDCLRAQRESAGARLWCERHSEHHPRAHQYSEMPAGFGAGSQLLR
ncbi:MAG TPA: universal stress protein [Polyangiaceae bacterium]|nr:universal stress protein [Polyangiaceae bacterium]